MKAYSIHWIWTPDNTSDDKNRGCTIVISDHLRQALEEFVDEYPDRSIDSVLTEGEDVLVKGEPV